MAETVGKYLTGLNTYWNWLEARGHIEKSSPWTRHRNKKRGNSRSEFKKRPFTDDEVVTLLRGNANQRLLDFMLISALSGMRLNEIGRLTVQDCANGVFTVSATKRGAKDRLVPIHSDLSDIISRRTKNKKPDDFLFHELSNPKPGSTRERADCITQEFGRYSRKVGIAETRPDGQAANDFHSFRRWFSTKLHQANILQHLAAAVVGHSAGSLTYDLYSGGPSRKQLQNVVEAVK